jgi:hypothetical protein
MRSLVVRRRCQQQRTARRVRARAQPRVHPPVRIEKQLRILFRVFFAHADEINEFGRDFGRASETVRLGAGLNAAELMRGRANDRRGNNGHAYWNRLKISFFLKTRQDVHDSRPDICLVSSESDRFTILHGSLFLLIIDLSPKVQLRHSY